MSLHIFKSAALCTASALMMSACMSGGYTPAEQEMAETMTTEKYQPATRELRNNIETQDLFAQAAFWSREYQLNPGDLESAIKLSAAVRKMGNPSKAIEIAQTSRALYPRDPYLAAELAAAYIADERSPEASQVLDTALRTAPGYARLWSLKGAALDQVENYDLARKHYARALEITPHDPNIMANVGLSFALQGDAKSAEGWLRRAAGIPGAGQSVHQNLALVLQLQGKNEEAERYSAQHLNKPKMQAPELPQQSYQMPQKPAPRPQASYMPRQQQAPTPATSLQSYEGRNSAPQTASEAARIAAQNSRRSSASVPGNPNAEQAALLDRIAKSLGPQSTPPRQSIPQQVMPPQMRPQQMGQQQMRPRQPAQQYAPQQQQAPQAYPQMGAEPQRRAPARRRG